MYQNLTLEPLNDTLEAKRVNTNMLLFLTFRWNFTNWFSTIVVLEIYQFHSCQSDIFSAINCYALHRSSNDFSVSSSAKHTISFPYPFGQIWTKWLGDLGTRLFIVNLFGQTNLCHLLHPRKKIILVFKDVLFPLQTNRPA